jgi:flagellin
MQVVQHNLLSQFAQRQFKIVSGDKSKSTEKLSSGYRINRSADDAAGLSISEKLRWQVKGLDKASKNIQDGISLIQVAEGGLNETHAVLQRARELAVQAANDTNTSTDRKMIQNEINQLTKEVDRIANQTNFNSQIYPLNQEIKYNTSVTYGDTTYTIDGEITKIYDIPSASDVTKVNEIRNLLGITDLEEVSAANMAHERPRHNGVVQNPGDIFFLHGLRSTQEDVDSLRAKSTEYSGMGIVATGKMYHTYDSYDYDDLLITDLKTDEEGYVYFDGESGSMAGKRFYLALWDSNDPEYIEFIDTVGGIWKDEKMLNIYSSKEHEDEYHVYYKSNVKNYSSGINNRSFQTVIERNSETITITTPTYKTEAIAPILNIQSGALEGQGIKLDLVDATSKGIGLTNPDVSSFEKAGKTIDMLDKAIEKVSVYRANFGAQQNRLEHAMAVDDNTSENTQAAESRIRDTDMAKEIVQFSKSNIIAQAAQSMLTQANQQPQGILSLVS